MGGVMGGVIVKIIGSEDDSALVLIIFAKMAHGHDHYFSQSFGNASILICSTFYYKSLPLFTFWKQIYRHCTCHTEQANERNS